MMNDLCISARRSLSVVVSSIVLHRALADISAQAVDDAFCLLSQARLVGRTIYVAGTGAVRPPPRIWAATWRRTH